MRYWLLVLDGKAAPDENGKFGGLSHGESESS